MSITAPVHFFYKNGLTDAGLAADYADASYPKGNLLDRIDGTCWKSTSLASQRLTHTDSVVADYLLINTHNLNGAVIGLESDLVSDAFSNASLAATWGTSVAGAGTVTETTSLALTSAAANDAAMLSEAATYSKTTLRRIRTRSKVTTASVDVTLQGLAYRTAVESTANFDADVLCSCYITTAGKIRARYYDAGATAFKYYDAGTGAWNTTSTNDLYAGALSTEYLVDLVNNGTSFRFMVYLQSTGLLLASTTWVAWSAARSSGTGNLTWYLGDPYNNAGTCAMTVYLAELATCLVLEQLSQTTPILRTFASTTKSTWSLFISGGLAAVPYMGGLQIGEETELDYADSLDMDAENDTAVVNVSDGGLVQGIHSKYVERRVTVGWNDADSAFWTKIKTWRDTVGLGLFGVHLGDSDIGSTTCWMMRRDGAEFRAPLTLGGRYRNISLPLIGRKE